MEQQVIKLITLLQLVLHLGNTARIFFISNRFQAIWLQRVSLHFVHTEELNITLSFKSW